MLIIFVLGGVTLFVCQKQKPKLLWSELFILLFRVIFLSPLFQSGRNKMQETFKISQEPPQKTRNSQGLHVKSEKGNSSKDLTWFSQIIMFSLVSSTWHFPTDKLLVWKFLSDRNPISAWTTVQSAGQNTTNCSMQYKCNNFQSEITLVVPSDCSVYLLQYHMLDKQQYQMHLLNHMPIPAISSPILIQNKCYYKYLLLYGVIVVGLIFVSLKCKTGYGNAKTGEIPLLVIQQN